MNDELLEEIQAAYAAHELWPLRCKYSISGFACPLTVLAISRGAVEKNDPRLELDEDENPAFIWACEEFGELWAGGFVNGFDEADQTNDDPEYLAGFDLAGRVLDQLFPREAPFGVDD